MILKVYADFPTEISEGRKSRKKKPNNNNSGRVLKKQERRDQKIAFLANQNLINYLSMGILFPSRQI